MSRPDDGGQAFPIPESEWDNRSEGMTLRDWFAGQALASLAQPGWEPTSGGAAEWAYTVAEAMIAEKRKREGGGA